MKHLFTCVCAAILLLSATPDVHAGFLIKKHETSITATTGNESVLTKIAARQEQTDDLLSVVAPRGRNSRGADKAFLLAMFSIFPVLGLVALPFVFYHGSRNMGGIRKHKGYAIAAMVLGVFSLVFSILILFTP
jgi:hypothetical protein